MQVPGSRREKGGMALTRSLGRIRVSWLHKFSFRSIESTQISSIDIPQNSGDGSILVLLTSYCGAYVWAEQLCMPGASGESGRGRSWASSLKEPVCPRIEWEGPQVTSAGGPRGDVPDHRARSPYRLMERFLMDGLYPSRFEMLLLPSLPTLLPAHPLPQGSGTRGRWENAQV